MKPIYRVPLMSEIANVEPNGMTVASLFSGCGGSSLGYKMEGFKVIWASEFIPLAAETYRANHAGTILDTRDIREVSAEEIMRAAGISVGQLDILDGSPPCSSFSVAGKRHKGWGETHRYSDKKQRTDDLFYEYARILRELQPRAFVAENVTGLVTGRAKGYFLEILAALKQCGYRVKCRLLDAQWLGVPQARRRVIFVGVREDLQRDPEHPQPLPYRYSLREALATLSAPIEADCDIARFAIGREYHATRIGQSSDRYFNLRRADFSLPCPTITATTAEPAAAGVVHPTECRKFSIAELKRICAFPDDFILCGAYEKQAERLGRAVPPVMMRHIARTIRDNILKG